MGIRVAEQVWRVARIFTVAFVAQLELLPAGHLQRAALASAAVAAVEATYRQVSPAGEARIVGWLSATLSTLAASAKASGVSVPGSPDAALLEAQKAVSEAEAAVQEVEK